MGASAGEVAEQKGGRDVAPPAPPLTPPPLFFCRYVAIELDDPFGDDENDLDVFGMEESVVNDARLFLQECDGPGADGVLGEKAMGAEPRSWTGERVREKVGMVDFLRRRGRGSTQGKGERDRYYTQRSSVEARATMGAREGGEAGFGGAV